MGNWALSKYVRQSLPLRIGTFKVDRVSAEAVCRSKEQLLYDEIYS